MRLLAPFRLVVRVVQRFRSERLAQTAAALSFATLVGLVPMIGVAATLLDHLPFAANIGAALEKFLLANLLPDKAGAVIAKYVGQFADRAGRMTMLGLGILAVTALTQMLTIEHTFNAIWKIKAPRPMLRRLAMHALALVLGPLVFGGSLAVISYLVGVSLGLVEEPHWVTTFLLRVIPFGFLAALFGLLYWKLPARTVAGWQAAVGGLLAATVFAGMHRLFGAYIIKIPTYTLVYGTFAAVPIFLGWLYLSWTVILVGALVTAELPRSARSG